jgi:hypothetical protein
VVAVTARTKKQTKGNTRKYAVSNSGNSFPQMKTFISTIIEPLGHQAKERNDEFNELYGKRLNLFVKEFIDVFCKEDGSIDWDKLILFNSGKEQPKRQTKKRLKT